MFILKVAGTIRRYQMIGAGDRVLVAISGGPDSVALTYILSELQQQASMPSFDLVLAHLNHQLRADEADEDEAFCARLAEKLEYDFVSEKVDVQGLRARSRRSLEEAGRVARQQFLEGTARRLACTRIALGHTQNDQAETVLLRMLRGAGTTGLGAIHPVVHGLFIRPLLEVKRTELLDYLAKKGLPYRLDSTNQDCALTRNRVRHKALPFLEKHFNPALVETLARNADLLRDDEDWMEQEALRALAEMVPHIEMGVERNELTLPVGALTRLHPALVRRAVRCAVNHLRGNLRGWTAKHVNDVLSLAAPGKSGRSLVLPGIHSGRSLDTIWLRSTHPNQPKGTVNETAPFFRNRRSFIGDEGGLPAQDGYNGYEYDYVLPVPGCLEIPEAGGVIQAEESRNKSLPAARGTRVVVALPETTERDTGLRVRNPRPGDRFRPLGAPGTKSLSRYLMEHRVERARRGHIPLVVRGNEVLWVVGHGISELSRVNSGTHRKLQLSWVEG
jgi:tRNA(Ile)-lysidine synthase